jgi:hypothetical protein
VAGRVAERTLARLEDERASRLLLAAAIAVYVGIVAWIGRDTTLFFDEINVFTVDRGFDPDALLAPLNGHLEVLLRFLYAIDFKLFGADFAPLRVVQAIGGALAAGALFALLRPRVGPPIALAATLVILFLGSAWEITFIQSGITHVYCVAAGLGAVLALERGDRRGDLLACALLVVSIASFTFGIAFAIGAAILIWLRPGRRRRLWVFVVPIALYAAWLIWVRAVYVPEHGNNQELEPFNLLLIWSFIADEAAAVAGALAGLNYDFVPADTFTAFRTESLYGALIAATAAAALVWRLARGGRTPFLWAAIAILLAIWIGLAIGFGQGRTPTTVRYVYAGGALAILVAAEAARGVRFSRAATLAAIIIALLALSTNIARLRDGINYYRTFAIEQRAQLTAVEIARDRVAAGFVPDFGAVGFSHIEAGPYLGAVDRIGSAGFSASELAGQREETRAATDRVLVSALSVALAPMAPAEPARDCRRVTAPAGGAVSIPAVPPGVALRSRGAADVALRRFASEMTVTIGSLAPGQRTALRLPTDRSQQPWTVVVSSPEGGTVTACALARGP